MMQYMAPWVPALTNAVNRHLESHNETPFVTFAFATVDADGAPRVRTCIFRGFLFNDRKTNVLTFTTDIRMEKYKHLLKNSKFEACFWFPATNEQFRINGTAKPITHDNLNEINDLIGDYPIISPNLIKSYSSNLNLGSLNQLNSTKSEKPNAQEWETELNNKWDALSGKLKSSFRKPEPGSKISVEDKNLLDSIARGVDGSHEADGTKNFVLVLLLPDKVDYVNLGGNHESRYIYERFDHDQWTEDEVCP